MLSLDKVTRGSSLAQFVNDNIDSKEDDRSELIEKIAVSADRTKGTINQILNGDINCPPIEVLNGFSDALNIPVSNLINLAEEDGCSYNRSREVEGYMNNKNVPVSSTVLQWLTEGIVSIFGSTDPKSRVTEPSDDWKFRATSMYRIFDQAREIVDTINLPGVDDVNDGFVMNRFIVDLYWDRGILYALVGSEGMLFRVDLTIEDDNVVGGQAVRVMETFVPVPRTQFYVTRENDGRERVTMIASTAILNRVNEIDSTKLYDSFIRTAEEENKFPEITCFHLPSGLSRLGETTYLAREGFVYIASYLLDDNEFGHAVAKTLRDDQGYWGASIEFNPTEREFMDVEGGVSIPVYTEGENPVITILPENKAATLFSANVSRSKGEEDMNDITFKDLTRLMGGDEELARKFAEKVDGINDSVTDRGLIARTSDTSDADADIDTNADSQEEEEDGDIVLTDDLVDAIIDKMFTDPRLQGLSSDGIDGIQESIDAITSSIRTLTDSTNVLTESTRTAIAGISTLDDRVREIEADEASSQREWEEDLPKANSRRRVSYRPRNEETRQVTPASLQRELAEGKLNLAEIAAQSVENIFAD